MLIGMMTLLVCVPSLAVQEGSTPQQEYEAILSDHKALLTERDQALGVVVRDARERGLRGDEIKEVYQKAQTAYGYERRLEPIARRALELARKHPEDPAALDALVWVIKRTTYVREAVALITADQVRDPRVGVVFQLMPYTPDPADERMGREVFQKNPSPEVRGQAARFLVRCFYNQARLVRRLRADPEFAGRDDLPFTEADSARLRRADPKELIEKAEAMFEQVRGEYDIPESFLRDLREADAREVFELEHLNVGQVAPEITGEDINGEAMKLSDYRGKVVALVCWATWCMPCMEMVPHERELVARFKGRPFALVGINGDTDRDKVKKTMQKEGMTWRSWWNGGPDGPIAKQWNIRGWPTVYVLDAKGVIRYQFGEEIEADSKLLDNAVSTLLKEMDASTVEP